jgi:S-formylglutathione hydrolase FrmB
VPKLAGTGWADTRLRTERIAVPFRRTVVVVKLTRRQLLGGSAAVVGVGASAAGVYWRDETAVAGPGQRTDIRRLRAAAAAATSKVGSLSRLVVTDPTGRRSPVFVWRPDGPDSADIPVLYFLHGVPGNAAGAAKTGVVEATAEAVHQRAGRRVVLVIPDGTGHRADTEWADSTDRVDLVATRVIGSVIPAVEGRHRRPARLRAIAGFSMGGYGAANLALQNPGLFGQWVSFDGYFKIDDPDGVFADQAARNANSPDRHAAAGDGQRVLLIEGANEGKLVHGEAARMAGLLKQAGSDVTVWTRKAGHNWAFLLSQWTPLLDWLEAGWGGRRAG